MGVGFFIINISKLKNLLLITQMCRSCVIAVLQLSRIEYFLKCLLYFLCLKVMKMSRSIKVKGSFGNYVTLKEGEGSKF